MDRGGGLRGLFLLLLPKKYYSFSKVRLFVVVTLRFFSLHSSSKFFVVELLLYELKAQCRRRSSSIVSARYSNENDEGHDTQFVSDGPDRSRRDVPNGKV